jgi:acyl-CoA reductase-like NAD-dependent aldehyde dehydrogenase
MISFTGSPPVGWGIKAKAPKKKVALELGGNAGCIVDADADLESCVPRIAVGGFHYAGQNCISVQRVLVHESLFLAFKRRIMKEVRENIKWGDPMKEGTVVGPMINRKEAERAMQWIAEAKRGGARVLCGGELHGNILEPTLLTETSPDMRVNCEEIFAPVMTVESFRDFDKAIAIVNDSDFGIHAGIFTRDVAKAFRAFDALEQGGVIINDYPTFRVDNLPYGGVKDSGFGREGLKYTMEEMTELKHLTINVGGY